MSNDRRKQYETATVLNQDFLNASQDNLINKLELIVDIEKPGGGFIHASDRNKYVVDSSTGEGIFYEALLTFPVIKRTIGEFLSPALEFSSLELELSNVDGRFNSLLPEGDNFAGWIGNTVTVKLGLGELADTYQTIFQGEVTDQGGFKRTVSSIIITARDRFDIINQSFPSSVLTLANFPDLEPDKENLIVPIVYGDWRTDVEPGAASVPTIVVNGNDPDVNGDTSRTNNVQLVICNHPLQVFDSTNVYLVRGENAWLLPAGDITNISIGSSPSSFEIVQNSGIMQGVTAEAEDQVLEFSKGDSFYVRVLGKDLGTYDNNIVAQAQDILETFAGLSSGDFDSSWNTLKTKSSPSQSAIASIKSRAYIFEQQNILEYVLSLLEQVRIEAFIDKNLKLKLFSLHLEDFEADPDHTIKNVDIEKGSFSPKLDDRNNFNRAKGVFNLLPNRNENFQETPIYKNAAAISQAGKVISKKIVFPNLYQASAVNDQVKEILKISSAYLENVYSTLTWRSMLLDIGDFVKLNVKIQSTEFSEVPAVIREIGYDPTGIKIPVRLWSFQMLPFPGYIPGNTGTVGGSTATITEET